MSERVSRRAAMAAGLSASAALAGCAVRAPVPKGSDDKSWIGQTVLPRMIDPHGFFPAPPGAPPNPDGTPAEASRLLAGASWEVKAEKGARVEVVEDGVYWVVKTDLVLLADAVAHFTKAIETDDTVAYNYNFRGWAQHLLGKNADAVKDFDQFLQIVPVESTARRVVGYSNRGLVLAEMGKFAAALKDLDEAVRLGHRPAQLNRGWMHELKGDYKAAALDYALLIETGPPNPLALNNLAWLKATCPDAAFRDGEKAVELAKKACEQTGDREGMILDTLAAARAEAGDFAAAVKAQELALADAGYARKHGTDAQERLQLYKDKKPFRSAPLKP